MHFTWSQAWDYLYGNRAPIGLFLYGLITAAVKTMPNPDLDWGDWKVSKAWLYDFFHQQFNITNNRLATTPIPTPPINKEQEPPKS